MAENKKSFILYCDIISTFEELKDNEAGRLIKHLLRYVNDLHPQAPDKLTKIAFEPIRLQLKRDLVRWDEFKKRQSENGKLGGRPKSQKNPKNPSLISKSQKSLNVTVTDTVIKKESKEKKIFAPSDLKNNREPVIPNREEVQLSFMQNGGSYEMANSFYDRCEATDWYFKGSPITNFRSMVNSFVTNWNKNLNGKFNEKSTSAPLKYV